MRKFIVVLLMVSMLIIPVTSFAEGEKPGVSVSTKAAALVDAESGRMLYEYNGNKKLPIASITKVMTLLLSYEAIENGVLSLDEKITASETAAGMGGSQAFIDAGYNYSVEDLIKSVIIASANDAAVLLAERISGSEEAFVNKMNKRASELGMEDTTFKNCTGLPSEGHLSSARDVAKMSCELLKHDEYFKWGTIWMDKLVHEKDGRFTELVNTNKLIRSLNGCDGLKTGYTSEAGFCVTTTAKRNGMRLISVVLGSSSSKERFNDSAKLINYGFANYENKKIVLKGEVYSTLKINNGREKECELIALDDIYLCVKNDGSEVVETALSVPENIYAPVLQGQKIGEIIISLNGKEVVKNALVSKNEYKKAGFTDRLKEIITNWN